jgi:hypothetical protein
MWMKMSSSEERTGGTTEFNKITQTRRTRSGKPGCFGSGRIMTFFGQRHRFLLIPHRAFIDHVG